MKNITVRSGVIRLLTILISAFLGVSVFGSCYESDGNGGEYKAPAQSDNGSDESEGIASENSSDSGDGAVDNGSGLPTVEFPGIPFD